MVRELSSAGVIRSAPKKRQQHFIRRQPNPDVEPEIAVVRHEHVGAADEGHRCAGLHRFMSLAGRGEGNFALAIELKAAALERAMRDHRTQQSNELLVAQAVALERR